MCGVSSDCLALGVALTGILEEAGRLGSAPAENGVDASQYSVALTFPAPIYSLLLGDGDYQRSCRQDRSTAPPSLPQGRNKTKTFSCSAAQLGLSSG